MCVDLVLLANKATSDKVVDKHKETWPPEVAFDNCLISEMSKVTRENK